MINKFYLVLSEIDKTIKNSLDNLDVLWNYLVKEKSNLSPEKLTEWNKSAEENLSTATNQTGNLA